MKRVLIIGLILTILSGGSYGQALKTFRIPAGVEIDEVVPFEELHLYPNFKKCAIHYVDGKSSLAMVNYNLLFQQMVVITVHKDTTFLKNDYLIKKFDFGDSLIINDYQYGLVEVLPDSVYPKLGKRDFLHIIPVDEGTYDGYSNFVDPSVTNIVLKLPGSYRERVTTDQFARSNIIAEKHVDYFIVDRNQRVFPASSSHIYKIFPRYREEIRQFVRKESINFKNIDELNKLILYCRNL